MNLAFPALLIFLFLLPGLFFTLAFYNTENKPLNYVSLTHKTAVSFFVTCLLHLIWMLFILFVIHTPIHFSQLVILISGVQGEFYTAAIKSISTSGMIGVVVYLLSIYIVAYLVGKVLRHLIRKFKLDRKVKILRLDSPWYYLFTGYDWEEGEPDGVVISAAVEFAGKGYLYVGYLENFFLDENGNIDRLVLTSAWRRNIKHDKLNQEMEDETFKERFYSVDGDYFVLKYNEIKNLNIQFIKIDEITEMEPA